MLFQRSQSEDKLADVKYVFIMKTMRREIITSFLAVIFLFGMSLGSYAQSDDISGKTSYIEFQKRFDDRAGMLTETEIAAIQAAADKQEQDIGLKAYLLIMPEILEWDFLEFARDQFDYWRMEGILNRKSYLILISVEDKKFEVVRGSYIDRKDNDYEVLRLRNMLYANLKDGNYCKAIVNYINGFSELPSLKKSISDEKNRNEKAGYYTLIGVLLLIFVFLRMGFLRRQREQQRKEKKERMGPFIE